MGVCGPADAFPVLLGVFMAIAILTLLVFWLLDRWIEGHDHHE